MAEAKGGKMKIEIVWVMLWGLMVLLVVVYLFTNSSEIADGSEIHTETITSVQCGSDSMGLIINCNDKIVVEDMGVNEVLKEGAIYIYDSGNYTAIHRLIKCLDDDCNVSVFKGDNNYIGEIVNKTQITKRLIAIRYE